MQTGFYMTKRGILIGISGASGSGKTLVAKTLQDALGSEKVLILQEDSYYKDLSHLPYEERFILISITPMPLSINC